MNWVDLRCDTMDDGTVFWWITLRLKEGPAVGVLASGMTTEEHMPEVEHLYFSGAFK
jgi:hypothetical protein